jgi:hypothetical protein
MALKRLKVRMKLAMCRNRKNNWNNVRRNKQEPVHLWIGSGFYSKVGEKLLGFQLWFAFLKVQCGYGIYSK